MPHYCFFFQFPSQFGQRRSHPVDYTKVESSKAKELDLALRANLHDDQDKLRIVVLIIGFCVEFVGLSNETLMDSI